MARTKAELNSEIARLIGAAPPHMSTGSTESKSLLWLVNSALGLGLDPNLSKPNLARAIVEASGASWSPSCESRGSTVTRIGLERVLAAVQFFVR